MVGFFNRLYRRGKAFYIKIIRSDHSPHSIGLAIALGVFVGCFVPLGLHTFIIILLAFIFRVDKIISYVATWIINPYTVAFIYPFFCYIGAAVWGIPLKDDRVDMALIHLIISGDCSLAKFEAIGKDILLSLMTGGFIVGLILAVVAYYLSRYLVSKYRKNNANIKLSRLLFYKNQNKQFGKKRKK